MNLLDHHDLLVPLSPFFHTCTIWLNKDQINLTMLTSCDKKLWAQRTHAIIEEKLASDLHHDIITLRSYAATTDTGTSHRSTVSAYVCTRTHFDTCQQRRAKYPSRACKQSSLTDTIETNVFITAAMEATAKETSTHLL
jgi:hypothetical protein